MKPGPILTRVSSWDFHILVCFASGVASSVDGLRTHHIQMFTLDAEVLANGAMSQQIMGHIVANESVHTRRKQDQGVCLEICFLCELYLMCLPHLGKLRSVGLSWWLYRGGSTEDHCVPCAGCSLATTGIHNKRLNRLTLPLQ